nr:reverse transcriptase domain-containing protein [Tanacetum cinerariifolium]GEZ62846.1 reverse transcriptase domain-containing protein [Tanacetum cinerariifolium]
MTHLLEKNTPFIFSEDCIKAFQTLKKKLTEAPILIAPNWDLPFELMCDASDFAIGAVLRERTTIGSPGPPNFPLEPMNTGKWVKHRDLKQALRGRHLMLIRSSSIRLKKAQEKDKIGSKSDKNGKRGEAEKRLKQLQ